MMIKLFLAIAVVESGLDPQAVGDGGEAIGILQIRPIMVKDCNRILKRKEFTLDDRWSINKSYQMLTVYVGHYGTGKTDVEKARQWNGGPKGHLKRATERYGRKIAIELRKEKTAAKAKEKAT